MSEYRGQWRPIPEALVDDPAWRQLSSDGRLVLITVRLSLGALGLAALPAAAEQLAKRSGLSVGRTAKALQELEGAGWLGMDANDVVLLRRCGFETEHTLAATNAKHVGRVRSLLAAVPDCDLKREFLRAFPEWFSDSQPHSPSDSHSDSLSDRKAHVGKPIPSHPIPSVPSPVPIPSQSGAGAPAGVATALCEELQRVSPCSLDRATQLTAELLPAYGDLLLSAARAWAEDYLGKPPEDLRYSGKDPIAGFVARAGYWVDFVTPGAGARREDPQGFREEQSPQRPNGKGPVPIGRIFREAGFPDDPNKLAGE